MSALLAGLSLLVLLAWLMACWQLWQGAGGMLALGQLPRGDGDLPPVSVVFSARDEGRKIEHACRSLLELDYPALEIIAINDRSTDDTGVILDALAEEFPRLKVRHVEDLPDGWLGKNHGLQTGYRQSTGEYVLFTDADVHFAPDTLRRVVPHVVDKNIDHLAATPRIINASPSLRLMLPSFSIAFFLNMRPSSINSDSGRDSVGVGAFNLVRRAALDEIGGLDKVRLRPDEDVKLGRVLRDAGFRQRIADGRDLLAVEWYRNAIEAIHGLEKNSFAFQDYSLSRVIGGFILIGLLFYFPLLAPFFLPAPAPALNLASLGLVASLHGWFARRLGMSGAWGLLYPFGMLLIVVAIANSTVKVLANGGVTWRNTHYPLDELKRNRV